MTDTTNKSSGVKRKLSLYIDDDETAKKMQLGTKIITKDNETIYTSWLIFRGISYFDNIINSGMKESVSQTLRFDFLTKNNTELYLFLITMRDLPLSNIIKILSDSNLDTKSLLSIYEQCDFHRIEFLQNCCIEIIKGLPYSIELYNFNVLRKIIDTKDMTEKFFNSTIKNNCYVCDSILPPVSDDDFWIFVFNHEKFKSISQSYIIVRHLDKDFLLKSLNLYKPYFRLNINELVMITGTEIFRKDENLIIFVNHILNICTAMV